MTPVGRTQGSMAHWTPSHTAHSNAGTAEMQYMNQAKEKDPLFLEEILEKTVELSCSTQGRTLALTCRISIVRVVAQLNNREGGCAEKD